MKKQYGIAAVSGVLFLFLILLVKTVDTATVGPNGTVIGLSHINVAVHEFCGVNIFWYKLTQVMGIIAILVAAGFALLGVKDLITYKSIRKVDPEILKLGGLYAVVILLYAFFEKVIINYRPIIMPDSTEVEASFPSTHTMLIIVIMGSALLALKHFVKDKTIRRICKVACVLIIVVTVLGRLICGVHWFTDILGGILISTTLLAIYAGIGID